MSIFKRTQRKYVKKAYRVRNWREYEAACRKMRGASTTSRHFILPRTVCQRGAQAIVPQLTLISKSILKSVVCFSTASGQQVARWQMKLRISCVKKVSIQMA